MILKTNESVITLSYTLHAINSSNAYEAIINKIYVKFYTCLTVSKMSSKRRLISQKNCIVCQNIIINIEVKSLND